MKRNTYGRSHFVLLAVLALTFMSRPAYSDRGGYHDDGCWGNSYDEPASSGCNSRRVERPRSSEWVAIRHVEAREGDFPHERLEREPGATLQATVACNEWFNGNRVDMDVRNGDMYWICGPHQQVQVAPVPTAPPEPAATPEPVVAEGGDSPRVLRDDVVIERGTWPRMYVEATSGADMIATYRCNGWREGTNPRVFPGDRIDVCGW